jgi:hypothetical protein
MICGRYARCRRYTTPKRSIKIIDTKIDSYLLQLMEITSLINVCRFENVPKKMTYTHRSLMYTFQPSECLFSQYTESKVLFVSFPSKFNRKGELHLIESSIVIMNFRYSCDHNVILLLYIDMFKDDSRECKINAEI